MSKSKIIQGKFVNKYKVPLDQIDDFNIKYDNLKKSLTSHGPNLAGAIKTELGITNFLTYLFALLKIFPKSNFIFGLEVISAINKV